MIEKIEHIGIAVNNLEESLKIYSGKLGLAVKEIEVSETAKAKIAMIPVGESNIELIEPNDPQSPIAKSRSLTRHCPNPSLLVRRKKSVPLFITLHFLQFFLNKLFLILSTDASQKMTGLEF